MRLFLTEKKNCGILNQAESNKRQIFGKSEIHLRGHVIKSVTELMRKPAELNLCEPM